MAPLLTCPTPEQLRLLALGELPEPVALACAGHIDQCPACLNALRRVTVDDPLLQALAPTECWDGAEATEVQRLIDTLSARAWLAQEDRTCSDEESDSNSRSQTYLGEHPLRGYP